MVRMKAATPTMHYAHTLMVVFVAQVVPA
uniref:Uncharacterized protein n=1 Tax=Arundo donax TaxID=35708 RepID=A0A0A8ZVG6_ARUDO